MEKEIGRFWNKLQLDKEDCGEEVKDEVEEEIVEYAGEDVKLSVAEHLPVGLVFNNQHGRRHYH